MSAFIDEYRARFGVELICRTLGVSASAYSNRASGHRSARRERSAGGAGRRTDGAWLGVSDRRLSFS